MGIVAHVQDIAVARTQKGKKMGLRVLEALVHAATEYGAFKVGVPPSQLLHRNCVIGFKLCYRTHGLNITGKGCGMDSRPGTTAHSQQSQTLLAIIKAFTLFPYILAVAPLFLCRSTQNNLLTNF